MKTNWLPKLEFFLLLLLAVFIFLVMYDCFVRGMTLKESLERRLLSLFALSLGRVLLFILTVAAFFAIYSVVFE